MPPRKLPPKLPISVFQTANTLASTSLAETRVYPASLIDAHVHLWDKKLMPSISWLKDDALGGAEEGYGYDSWSRAVREVLDGLPSGEGKREEGFVFVQVEVDHDDRDRDGSKAGWDAALGEVAWCVDSVRAKLVV